MTSQATSNAVASTARPFTPRRLALAGAVALVVNVLIFLAAGAADAAMSVTAGSAQDVTAVVVGIATVVPLALAGLVTWLVARRSPGFRPIAAWLGLGVALVSVVIPLTGAADTLTGVALAAMHVVTGVAWFIGLRPGPSSHRRLARATS